LAGATVMVNAVCEPVPENVSVRNAAVKGVLPMKAMLCLWVLVFDRLYLSHHVRRKSALMK